MNLRGATALVTGGARRLGRHITRALAAAGANVVIAYRHSRDAAETVAEEARALGVTAIALQADVADGRQFDRLLARALAALPRIDILVANAGAFRRTPLITLTEADWDDMQRDNLDAFCVPARRIGRRMQEQGGGCIVALADVGGLQAWPDYPPYCIAKSGVIALARALAIELAPQVRVNAIAPGPILFPSDGDATAYRREIGRTLLQRSGTADDISDAVLFLARNDYVTGVVLPVDGGRLLG